jgi:DNA polymerase I-like protein with 3'-5' exonuclease and polymerase domains
VTLPFAILEPVISEPRLSSIEIEVIFIPSEDFSPLWEEFSSSCMAIDLETDGKALHEGGRVVGVGFSDERGSLYIDLKQDHNYETFRYILEQLAAHKIPLIAHNLFFDGAFLESILPDRLTYLACTYATYRHLANEGWEGQTFGLKKAQVELLGWKSSNEVELDRWLLANGYVASYSKTPKEGYYEVEPKDGEKRWASPSKGEMHNAPASILGHYCCLDADATYQLWKLVLEPALSRFHYLRDYLTGDYVTFILLLIRQYSRGVLIDREFLLSHKNSLEKDRVSTEKKLVELYRKELDLFNAEVVKERLAKEPPKFLKGQELGPEPPKYTSKGVPTMRWLKWEHERIMRDRPNYMPTISANWATWLQHLIDDLTTEHFNWSSGPQKTWLFYEALGYPVLVTTDKGNPAVGEEALLGFGEGGKLLLERDRITKEMSSIDSLLAQLGDEDVYHPRLKVPGTHTGRLAGAGDYNWQNPPKSPYMQAFVARPGHSLVSCDIASLENVVLTELSRDSTLWSLYGPDAKPNDGYLYFGSQLPIIGPVIRAAGYDPHNPTAEGVSLAKKVAKKERDIAKVIVLSSSYGAGPAKIQETLTLAGIPISLEECRTIHSAYWALLGGVKSYEKELVRQWRDNRGWLLNGVGRPIGVHEDYLKDITNRVIQSTGHDLFISFLLCTFRLLGNRFKLEPWNADVHDCWYVELPEELAEEFCRAVREEVLPEWNRQIGGLIRLKAEPAILSNLWQDKAEKEALVRANEFALQQRERLGKKRG